MIDHSNRSEWHEHAWKYDPEFNFKDGSWWVMRHYVSMENCDPLTELEWAFMA
jgi:hypothetical protein